MNRPHNRTPPRRPWAEALGPLASLKLTVVLLALAMVLVFAGTLAQVDQGIYQTLGQYFRTFVAWIDLQVFFPRQVDVSGSIPFPGGWAIGAGMLVNLLAAHLARFRMNWRSSGIFLIHAGLIVLLVGELVTGLMASEGTMLIREGGEANYIEHSHHIELAVIDRRDPAEDVVTVIPGPVVRRAARQGITIAHELLPFAVDIERDMAHAVIVDARQAGRANPATAGEGLTWLARPRPPVSGVDPEQRVNLPAVYARFIDEPSGKTLGVYLLSPALGDVVQPIEVNDETYHVALRFARTYKPYTLELIDFTHDRYLGTDIPRNFSSRVRLIDPRRHEDREVLIYMNHPLRHAGETFYQASFTPDERGTVLQVVRNPGWLLPYVASAIISLGLVIQFLLGLTGAGRRKGAA